MRDTLDGKPSRHFSESALFGGSAGGARPGHRPAGWNAQGAAVRGEAGAVARRRLPHDRAERAAECAEADEADVEADVGHRSVRFAQQLHRPLDPAPLEVAVRRLAERGAELPAEVSRRGVRDACERGNVERLGERTIHGVTSAQHAAVAVLDHSAGSRASKMVPAPGSLSIVSTPPAADTRSRSPWRPQPGRMFAPPAPSSPTSTRSWSPACSTSTQARRAQAYFATFANASETVKYAAASTDASSCEWGSVTRSSTGTAAWSARLLMALASPRS